jgi:hypothetical protein
MLHAAEPLFFRRSNKLAIADERGRRITVECIKPQNDHTRPTELVSADLSDGTERSRTLLGAKAAHQAMPHGGGSFRIERDCLIVTHERAYA